MDKTYLDALAEVPALVENTNHLIDTIAKRDENYAKVLLQRVKATVPDDELQKVSEVASRAVAQTQCAMPDAEAMISKITDGVLNDVQHAVGSAVEQKIKSMPIQLEHHHTHVTAFSLVDKASEAAKTMIVILVILCGVLILAIGGNALKYYNSDVYWGQKYLEIVTSKYITKEEKALLWQNVYAVSALPPEFDNNPDYVIVKMKQNKAVIEERQKEAKANKGRWSVKIPIER